MIDREHDLPIVRQARALNISRGSVYYLPRPVPDADLAIMRRLDWLHLEFPFAGSRMLRGLLAAEGCKIGRRHVKTLMRRRKSRHRGRSEKGARRRHRRRPATPRADRLSM
jgi:putative transposase